MKQTDRLALLDWEKYKEDIAKGLHRSTGT